MYNFPLLGGDAPNRCEICNATFADKDLLKGHLLIHLEERPLPWEMHQIGIISRVMAPPLDKPPIPIQPPAVKETTPKRRPTEQKDGYMCDMCGSHFTSLSGMTRHRQKHLKDEGPPKDRKHRCPQCGYSTDNIANLVAHVRAHTGERPFRCEECDKSFSRKNTLDSHRLVHTDERPFRCEVCDKRYKSERTLVAHERKHAPFTCDACGESFAFLRFLRAHEKREHAGGGKGDESSSSNKCEGCGQGVPDLQTHQCPLVRGGGFQCPHCPFSTDVRGSLNAHVRRMHVGERRPPGDLRCEVCSQVFSSPSELQGHQRKLRHFQQGGEGGGAFPCPHCPFSADMKGHLNAHIRRSHVGERRHACKVCGKAFFEANKLNRHLRTHSGKCVFVCSTCGLNFTDWAAWREHEKSHAGWEIFSCPVCRKVFLRASDLRDHELEHAEGYVPPPEKQNGEQDMNSEKEPERHQCVACSRLFSCAGDLKRHQRRLGHASRPAQFGCPRCTFSTEKRACLVAHERRVHGGERPHLCEVCGRAFFEACKLKRHLRLHSGERPFKCGTCGKGFVGGTELRRHERLHSGEKPFECGFCGKRFMLLYKLKNHEHKHRVLEPLLQEEEKEKGSKKKKAGKKACFKCKMCDSTFPSLLALVRHKKTMHKTRKHHCKGCSYTTLHRSCLVAHQRSHWRHCSFCNKAFAHQRNLDAHVKNHRGPKTAKSKSSSLKLIAKQKTIEKTSKEDHTKDVCRYKSQSKPISKRKAIKMNETVDEGGREEVETDDSSCSTSLSKIDTRQKTIETSETQGNEGRKEVDSSFLKTQPPKSVAKRKAAEMGKSGEDFVCSGCGKGHGSSSELQKHILEEHMVQELNESTEKGVSVTPASEQLKKILEEQKAAEPDKEKEIGVFKCDSCDRVLSSLFSLKKHLKSHQKDEGAKKGEPKYHCSLCDYATAFRLSLKYHLRSHSEPHQKEERQKADDSSKQGGKKRGGRSSTQHRCPQCNYSSGYSSSLRAHLLSHQSERPFPCPLCPQKRFKDAVALRSHQRTTHSTEKRFPCDACGKAFKHAASLRNHDCVTAKPAVSDSNKDSNEARKWKEIKLDDDCKCETCETLLRALNEHRKTHFPEPSPEPAPKGPPRKLKKRVTSPRKPRRFQCEECDYSTPYRTNLASHQKKHIKPRVFKCEVCGDLFTTRSAFTCHKKSHPELREEFGHRCPECPFATSSERKLRTHAERIHEGRRPHRCPDCGKGFFQADELRRHARAHTGERPFACATCDKRFTIRGHLTIHERTHLLS